MSTATMSHAEPTLFLTSCGKFQVRAHTTRKGNLFFCISDFIRNVLVEKVSNNEAVDLWLKIGLVNKDHEVSLNTLKIILACLTFDAVSHSQQHNGAVRRTV